MIYATHLLRMLCVNILLTLYVALAVGTPVGLDATDAYPVPYPDSAMEGRPALPPEHTSWEQERNNIIEWFTLLYCEYLKPSTLAFALNLAGLVWQGASEGPDWNRIKDDINEQRYVTIDKHRLPPKHLPFEDPDDWDEDTT
ncbi:hypothetical protein FS749_002255 [Ceratobasidium sp. UAMH 11750]|nr:hypothetical protein FS749_002255 [Ceratobasidium sp. UAMH 11750]